MWLSYWMYHVTLQDLKRLHKKICQHFRCSVRFYYKALGDFLSSVLWRLFRISVRFCGLGSGSRLLAFGNWLWQSFTWQKLGSADRTVHYSNRPISFPAHEIWQPAVLCWCCQGLDVWFSSSIKINCRSMWQGLYLNVGLCVVTLTILCLRCFLRSLMNSLCCLETKLTAAYSNSAANTNSRQTAIQMSMAFT